MSSGASDRMRQPCYMTHPHHEEVPRALCLLLSFSSKRVDKASTFNASACGNASVVVCRVVSVGSAGVSAKLSAGVAFVGSAAFLPPAIVACASVVVEGLSRETTASTYGSAIRPFLQFCAEQGVPPLGGTAATVASYIAWQGLRGTVKAASLQPYLSAINGFYRHQCAEPVAQGDFISKVRKGLAASQVEPDPPRVRTDVPARLITQALRLAETLHPSRPSTLPSTPCLVHAASAKQLPTDAALPAGLPSTPCLLPLPVEQREGVPHHLIDILPPDAEFPAGDFYDRGKQAVEDILKRGKVPLVECAVLAGELGRECTRDEVFDCGVAMVRGAGDEASAQRLEESRNSFYRLMRVLEGCRMLSLVPLDIGKSKRYAYCEYSLSLAAHPKG
eukprot:jgi/Tetstr1/446058/TSEL_033660.t1